MKANEEERHKHTYTKTNNVTLHFEVQKKEISNCQSLNGKKLLKQGRMKPNKK